MKMRRFIVIFALMMIFSTLPILPQGASGMVEIKNDVDIPVWIPGDWWEYDFPLHIRGNMNGTEIEIQINQRIKYTVDGITTYSDNHTGREWDTYHLTTTGDFTGTIIVNSMSLNLDGDIYGQRFVSRSDLSIVRDETTLDGKIIFLIKNVAFKLVLNNTYAPPMEYYDFPLNVGEEWYIDTTVYTDGYFWFEGVDLRPFYDLVINETKQDISDKRDISTQANCTESYKALVGSNAVDVYHIEQGSGGYVDVWYSPQIENYYKLYIEGYDSSNFTFDPVEITLKDYGLKSQNVDVNVNLVPSTVAPDHVFYVTGHTIANSDIVVLIPFVNIEVNGRTDENGKFNVSLTSPHVMDNTPTYYDIGSFGILVGVNASDGMYWGARTLSVVAPDISIYPDDITLVPPSPSEGMDATINITVHNNNISDMKNITVCLGIENFVLKRWFLPVIPMGHTTTLSYTWHVNLTPGIYRIWANATVAGGEINTKNNNASRFFRVNSPPEAKATFSPAEPRSFDEIIFNASASYDKDGRIVAYFFDFGDGSNSSWVSSPTVSHSYSHPGEYIARVYVRDNDDGVSDAFLLEVNVANLPPEVRFTVNGLEPPLETEFNNIVINASLSTDRDGHIVAYNYSFGDGSWTGWCNASVVEHRYVMGGVYTIEVMVKDDMDAVSTANTTITITNNPPHISVSVNMRTLKTLEEFMINVSAFDLDSGDSIAEVWIDWNSSGMWEKYNRTGNFSHIYHKGGNYSVVIRAFDTRGAYAETTVNITVENRLPDFGIIPSSEEIYRGVPVKFMVTNLEDEDGTVVDYYWTLPNGTEVHALNVTVVFNSLGKTAISFTAVDDCGGIKTVPFTVNVKNQLPVIKITGPMIVNISEVVHFHVIATDNDGTVTNITWTINGVGMFYGTDINITFHNPGSYNITVIATDNDGGISKGYFTIEVLNPGNATEGKEKTPSSAQSLAGVMAVIIIVIAIIGAFLYITGRKTETDEKTEKGNEEEESENTEVKDDTETDEEKNKEPEETESEEKNEWEEAEEEERDVSSEDEDTEWQPVEEDE